MTETNFKKCNSEQTKVTGIYLFKKSDAVFKDGVFVRMKRKYGKFDRQVHFFKTDEEIKL